MNELTKRVPENPERILKQKLDLIRERNIFIYGAGGFGKETYEMLVQHHLKIEAFLDRNAEKIISLFDIPVYQAQEEHLTKYKENAVVLLAIVMDKNAREHLIAFLKKCGFSFIIEAQSLRCLSVKPDNQENLEESAYYKSQKNKINEAAGLFQEELSYQIYWNNVNAHITRDYEFCSLYESPMEEQYFPGNICLIKGYDRMIDCGGFIGDTIESALRHHGKISAIASFEPNQSNFQKLSAYCDSQKERIGLQILFPCAVSKELKTVKFRMGCGSGAIDAEGSELVQSVSLDQVLKGFHPTFLKMDIEGEEINALYGAKEMIMENKPDLAICVYHCVNHIWDIPLLLQSWNLNYQFYLRSYNAFTMETVLYATVGNH